MRRRSKWVTAASQSTRVAVGARLQRLADTVIEWVGACRRPDTLVDIPDEEDPFDWSDPEGESAWDKMPKNY